MLLQLVFLLLGLLMPLTDFGGLLLQVGPSLLELLRALVQLSRLVFQLLALLVQLLGPFLKLAGPAFQLFGLLGQLLLALLQLARLLLQLLGLLIQLAPLLIQLVALLVQVPLLASQFVSLAVESLVLLVDIVQQSLLALAGFFLPLLPLALPLFQLLPGLGQLLALCVQFTAAPSLLGLQLLYFGPISSQLFGDLPNLLGELPLQLFDPLALGLQQCLSSLALLPNSMGHVLAPLAGTRCIGELVFHVGALYLCSAGQLADLPGIRRAVGVSDRVRAGGRRCLGRC
jgi:hypothetical protein